MKPGLKRIEDTLGQLSHAVGRSASQSASQPASQSASQPASQPAQPLPESLAEPPIMAQIAEEMAQEMVQDWVNIPAPAKALQSFPLPAALPQSAQPLSQPLSQLTQMLPPAARQAPVQRSRQIPKSSPPRSGSLPQPKAKPASFSSHQHALNPNLAVGLLKEVESVVVSWQLQLEQTVLEIQALYLEGPIIDGWLESHPAGSPQVMQIMGATTLRHAEIERLMDSVEEICRTAQVLAAPDAAAQISYRLCGLDADGQLWSRPCPSQQMPYVGLAIARYQKLRILLARKQALEMRLHRLIQNLTLLHGQMQS